MLSSKRVMHLFNEFMKHINLAEASRIAYNLHIKLFFRHTEIEDAREVKKQDLEAYLDYLWEYADKKGQKLAETTISFKMKALRQLFNFLQQAGYILLNPCDGVPETSYARKIRSTILSEREIQRLLESIAVGSASGLRDKTILELLYATGLRRKELLSIKVQDVNLDEGLIFIKGKGNKERIVPLGDNMLALLKAYLQQSRSRYVKDYREEYLFLTYEGKQLGGGGLKAILTKYLKLAGIKKQVCLHSIRHSFATHMLTQGVDLRYIQAILGHESLSTTQIYINLTVPGLRKLYDKHHPLENELYFDVKEREKYVLEKPLPQKNRNWKGWKKTAKEKRTALTKKQE